VLIRSEGSPRTKYSPVRSPRRNTRSSPRPTRPWFAIPSRWPPQPPRHTASDGSPGLERVTEVAPRRDVSTRPGVGRSLCEAFQSQVLSRLTFYLRVWSCLTFYPFMNTRNRLLSLSVVSFPFPFSPLPTHTRYPPLPFSASSILVYHILQPTKIITP